MLGRPCTSVRAVISPARENTRHPRRFKAAKTLLVVEADRPPLPRATGYIGCRLSNDPVD